MSLPVVLRQRARQEFDDGIDWYERQQPGLGVEFADRIQEVFDRISAMPEMYAEVRPDIRKAPARRFPYSIFFRIRANRIVVLAVFHNKRNPRSWQSRG